MLANEELILLIKSRYPVIFVESIDEQYVINQLRQIASQLGLAFYQWSVTTGLQKGSKEGGFYQTGEPEKMVKTVLSLIRDRSGDRAEPGLFVLKDFDKHLENVVILRLFKDLINLIKNTKNTVVIVAPQYNLPKDIEPEAGHIVGGYPDEREIASIVKETCSELGRYDKRVKTSLTLDEIQKVITSLKGLSVQQIRNILNPCLMDDGLLDINDLNRIESYKKKLFDQEGLLEFCGTESKDNIANFDNLKRWLEERRSSFTRGLRHSRLRRAPSSWGSRGAARVWR